MPRALVAHELGPRQARRERVGHAAGTRSSCVPWCRVTGPATASGVKPQGRAHATYSSTMPSPCSSAWAAACAMPGSGSASRAAPSSGTAPRVVRWAHASGRWRATSPRLRNTSRATCGWCWASRVRRRSIALSWSKVSSSSSGSAPATTTVRVTRSPRPAAHASAVLPAHRPAEHPGPFGADRVEQRGDVGGPVGGGAVGRRARRAQARAVGGEQSQAEVAGGVVEAADVEAAEQPAVAVDDRDAVGIAVLAPGEVAAVGQAEELVGGSHPLIMAEPARSRRPHVVCAQPARASRGRRRRRGA